MIYLFVVFCFSKKKKTLSSCPRRKWTCVGIFASCISIINKKVVLIPTLFLFCVFFWKNGNTKNPKRIIIFKYVFIIITFIYLLKSTINHTLINTLNTLTLYSLPTLSSMCSKLKKRRMKRFPMRSLAYWGILAVRATIKISRRLSRKWHSLTKTARDATICLECVSYFKCTLQQGQPLFPQYTTWRLCLPWRSESRQWKFWRKPRRMKLAFDKEGSSPWISKRRPWVQKIYYLFNQTPEAKGCLIGSSPWISKRRPWVQKIYYLFN